MAEKAIGPFDAPSYRGRLDHVQLFHDRANAGLQLALKSFCGQEIVVFDLPHAGLSPIGV